MTTPLLFSDAAKMNDEGLKSSEIKSQIVEINENDKKSISLLEVEDGKALLLKQNK
jgi:hypothetical protein